MIRIITHAEGSAEGRPVNGPRGLCSGRVVHGWRDEWKSGNRCVAWDSPGCRAEPLEGLTMGFWMATNADC